MRRAPDTPADTVEGISLKEKKLRKRSNWETLAPYQAGLSTPNEGRQLLNEQPLDPV